MSFYYDRLSAERLRRCYEVAPPEVQAYLEAEVQYILATIPPGARVLELGCGYGRVLSRLAGRGALTLGVDLSFASLALLHRQPRRAPSIRLAQMNAAALALRTATFDLICCPQNGISAFHVDQRALLESSIGLLVPGGQALFFSYAESFWPHRLSWFRAQAAHGLVGEIDEAATGDGTIVCNDGFTATTVPPGRFLELSRGLGSAVTVAELQRSSVVCEIVA